MKRSICLWRFGNPLDESILQEGANLKEQVAKALSKAYESCELVNRDRIPYLGHYTHISIHEGPVTLLKLKNHEITSDHYAVAVDSDQ